MVEMKPSGVQWLGDIPKEWNLAVLGKHVTQVKNKNTALSETNLLSLSYGKIKRKDISSNDGLLPSSFDGYNIIEEGDIVLRLTDLQNDHTSLRVGRATERGIITSAYVTIRPGRYLSSEYLYYVLHSFDIVKGFYGMGSGIRQGLTYDGVQSLKIPSPEISEQRSIVDYLDERCSKIDEIIAEATASIEEYKELKQAVIDNYTTQNEFPYTKLKYLSLQIGDGIHTTPKYDSEGTYQFINGGAFGNERIKMNGNAITEQEYRKWNTAILNNSTIMIALNGTYGNTSLYEGEPILLGKSGGYITLKENINRKYIRYCLANSVTKEKIDLSLNGTTIPNLSLKTLRNLSLCVPTIDVQNSIADTLDREISLCNDLISEKQALIEDLQAYKKSLIYEVVTGKRRVV